MASTEDARKIRFLVAISPATSETRGIPAQKKIKRRKANTMKRPGCCAIHSLVKAAHVAHNADIYSLSTHLVNTLTLLACLTLPAWWGSGKPLVRVRGKAAWLAAIGRSEE